MTNPLASARLRAVAPLTYQQTILADSPVAYWTCQDAFGASTLVDSSGNARTLTLGGTRTLGAKAKNSRLGSAVNWNAASGFASVAAAAWHQIVGDVSVECWLHLAEQPASGQEIQLLTVGAVGETLATNVPIFLTYTNIAGTLQLLAFHESGAGVDTSAAKTVTLGLNDWHHIVMVRDTTAKTYEFFVDSVSLGTASYATNPAGATTAGLRINGSAAAPSVGDIRSQACHYALYNAKLSAARIFEHYRAGRLSNTNWNNTTLLCKFDGANAAVAAADESSYGSVLTFSGNAQLTTAQFKFGTASLLLDGTGDFVTATDSPIHKITSQEFTMEAWIRINVGARVNTILSKRDGAGAEEFSFYVDASNHLVFQPNNGAAIVTLTGTTALSTATWYHVCAQRTSGNVWSVYLNGVVEATSTTAGTATTNTQGLTVGRNVFNTAQDFNGWIDSVRFTLGAARYAAAGFTAPTAEFNPYE